MRGSKVARRASGLKYIDPASLFVGNDGLYFKAKDLTRLWQDDGGATPVTTAGQSVGKITSQSPSAVLAIQATAGAKPTYTETDGLPGLTIDGGDHLDSDFRASATEMTIAAIFKATGGVQYAMGMQAASTGRCHVGLAVDGTAGGAWGNQNTTTIKGNAILANKLCGVLMRGNAIFVELYAALSPSDVVLQYRGPPNGAPTTSLDYFFGGNNQNGAIASRMTGVIHEVFANKAFALKPELLLGSMFASAIRAI